MRILEYYVNRADRDEAFKAHKAAGRDVTRRTCSSVVLSPTSVIGVDPAMSGPNGYGGREATFFAKLYKIEEAW